ncbi:M48 family metalloprotease [Pantoea sp. SORGH_AS_0659]|uniref:M48 family metalloprotease n=1 Tax=Pantoea sp. SORGH_AS_0659 TaxID=3062597 RepID=UPI002854535A|nr:M48 family metalloprotease [Pantoea sp. SORGH_AS_0659]MDR6349409.1 hypothetical protein [Pantoea sp. SORGH_AS_0659]
MSEEQDFFDRILAEAPNARRASQGVLIESGNVLLHLTGVIKHSDLEGLSDDASFYASFCSREDIERIKKPKVLSDFLLQIRAEAIVDNPRLIRVFRKRKGNKKDWSLDEYYKSKFKESIYLKSLSKGNQKKLEKIPAGSAYLDNVNATCMKTVSGNIIAISESLENYLYFMNIFFYGDDFGLDQADTFSAYLIAQRIMAGHESYDFDLDSRGELPTHFEDFLQSLTNLQYQFILGHEYAHHLLGHLNDSRLFKEDLSIMLNAYQGDMKIQHYKYSHKLEYDADWHAIKNIKGNSLYKGDIANAAFLTLMYFETSRLILDYTNPMRGSIHSSHPSPTDRILKLRSRLNNKRGFSREQLENNIEYLTKYTDHFLKEYLAFNFDSFEKYGSVYLPNYKKKLLLDRVEF